VTQATVEDLTDDDKRKLMRDNLADFLVGSH